MAPAVETLYKAYKDKVQFLLIYTREIHPAAKPTRAGEKPQPDRYNRRGGPAITQHESMKDRVIAADACMKGLKLTIPTLLDNMENTFTKTYAGMPAGTTVVDINGKIVYWNHGAPNGARPKEAEAAIKKLLAAGGEAIPAKWAAVKIPSDRPKKAPTTQPAKVSKETAEAKVR